MKAFKCILISLLILSIFGIFINLEKDQVKNLTTNIGFSKHMISFNTKNYDLKEVNNHELSKSQRYSNSNFTKKQLKTQYKATEKKKFRHLLAQKKQTRSLFSSNQDQQNYQSKSIYHTLNYDIQTSKFNTTFANKKTSSNLIALNTFNTLIAQKTPPSGPGLEDMNNPDMPLQEDFICLSSLLMLFLIYKRRIS